MKENTRNRETLMLFPASSEKQHDYCWASFIWGKYGLRISKRAFLVTVQESHQLGFYILGQFSQACGDNLAGEWQVSGKLWPSQTFHWWDENTSVFMYMKTKPISLLTPALRDILLWWAVVSPYRVLQHVFWLRYATCLLHLKEVAWVAVLRRREAEFLLQPSPPYFQSLKM